MRRIALASIALFAILSAPTCSKAPQKETPPRDVHVETATVTREGSPTETAVDATVVALKEAIVASRLAAPVARVNVKAGDRVREGETLVELDARETDAALEGSVAALDSARTALDVARRNLRRFETLSGSGAAAAVELDRARMDAASADAQVRAAESSRRRAEADKRQARLTAPFDAVVVDRLVDEGELALPGKPLVRLASLGGRRAEAAVSEDDSVRLARGQRVDVLLGPTRVEGRITEIVAAVDQASRRRIVRIDLPGSEAPVGTFARVLIPGVPSERVSVSSKAVVPRGGLELAFVVDAERRVALRYVRTGASLPGGRIEIRSGLVAGERVVLDPPADLPSGARVAP